MTVIVGVANKDGAWLSGDRSTSDGKYIEPMLEPKIYKRGQYLCGSAGNIGIGQAVSWHFDFPPTKKFTDMFTKFQPALNEYIDTLGIDKTSLVGDEGSMFLITAHATVWAYNVQDGQLVPYTMTDIGSGGGVAVGSLHTSTGSSNNYRRVKTAAEVACQLVVTCHGPVDVLYLEGDV